MKNLKSLLKPAKEKDKFHCPACGGHNFTINNTTGAYNCWNGCSTQTIKAAIREQYPGFLSETERKEKAPRECKITEYIYTDREGNQLIKVKKTVTGVDGENKKISQYHWTGKTWKLGYGPVKTPDIPLYRYTEIMEVIERGEPIVLCEGESTADAFWEIGIPATTTIGGTGKTVVKRTETIDKRPIVRVERNLKTFESIKPALADLSEAEVILAPDQDKPGCLHMEMMAELLNVKGWLYAFPDSWQWTRLKDKGGCDFVDWIYDYPKLTKEEILRYVVPKPTHEIQSSTPEQQQLQLASQPSFPEVVKKKRPRASIIAKQLGEAHPHLLYIATSKTWMLYEASNQGVWEKIPEELVERLAIKHLEKLGFENFDKFSLISNTLKFLRTGPAFRKDWKETESNLLPFTNGVLNLSTGSFSQHHPDNNLTWTLPRPHVPTASEWQTIDAWLDFVTQGKSGLRTILECFAAAILKGRADLQKFLHLMGRGGSGKGTYMRLITSLIGSNNVVSSDLERFCTSRFEAARVRGKRLVIFADERNKPSTIRDLIKLTGQDSLSAEEKWKEAFNFTYNGMVVLASESPIFYGEMGYGLVRRTILLPMNARVEDKDRRDLQADFEPELAAFTNHLLSLPDDFVSEVLKSTQETPEIEAYRWKARLREDSIAAWLDESLIYDPEAETSYTTLYESYRDFCQQSGNQTKSKNKFSAELPDVCELLQWSFQKQKTALGRVIKGLRVRQRGEHSDYPSETFNSTALSNNAKMTTLVTTCDDLDDDLKSDYTKGVTTMTTCSNLLLKNKKIEEKKEEKIASSVKNDTQDTEKLVCTTEMVRSELQQDWEKSKTKPNSTKEKDFKAKFNSSKGIENVLKYYEQKKLIMRNNGRIYNAYSSIYETGETVYFKGGNPWLDSGVVEAINFPHYTVKSGDKMFYLHCFDLRRTQ